MCLAMDATSHLDELEEPFVFPVATIAHLTQELITLDLIKVL